MVSHLRFLCSNQFRAASKWETFEPLAAADMVFFLWVNMRAHAQCCTRRSEHVHYWGELWKRTIQKSPIGSYSYGKKCCFGRTIVNAWCQGNLAVAIAANRTRHDLTSFPQVCQSWHTILVSKALSEICLHWKHGTACYQKRRFFLTIKAELLEWSWWQQIYTGWE